MRAACQVRFGWRIVISSVAVGCWNMEERLSRLEVDMSGVKADVAVLKVDVAVLKVDVAVLKSDVAVLKHDVHELRGHQERDFRVLFGALIVATVALAGLMAKGFNWV